MPHPIVYIAGLAKGLVTLKQVTLLVPSMQIAIDDGEKKRKEALEQVPEGDEYNELRIAIKEIPLNPIPEGVRNFKRFFKGIWRQKIWVMPSRGTIVWQIIFSLIAIVIGGIVFQFVLFTVAHWLATAIIMALGAGIYALAKYEPRCSARWASVKTGVKKWLEDLGEKTKKIILKEHESEKSGKIDE